MMDLSRGDLTKIYDVYGCLNSQGMGVQLIMLMLACLLACLLAWLAGCLLACLVGWLVGWLIIPVYVRGSTH